MLAARELQNGKGLAPRKKGRSQRETRRVMLGGRQDTGQGKGRDREGAPESTRKAIFHKVCPGPPTHLADERELVFPYVVTIQPKGEDSS